MKKSFKKWVSSVLVASMALTSIFSNAIMTNADDAVVVAEESVSDSAIESTDLLALSGQVTVNAFEVLTNGVGGMSMDPIIEGSIYAYNMGASATQPKPTATDTFDDGTKVTGFVQVGKGNEFVTADVAVGTTVDTTAIEKGIVFMTDGPGTAKIYAASGSSGIDAFNLALINYTTGEVVDVTSTDGSDGVYEVTNVTFPGAGTYVLLVPAKQATLNFATISVDISGEAPVETSEATTEEVTEATTEAPTEEPTAETTTEAPVTPSGFVGQTTVNAFEALPNGVGGMSMDAVVEGAIYAYNMGASATQPKPTATDTFDDGTTVTGFVQVGKGNEFIASDVAVGTTVDTAAIEKGIVFMVGGPGTATVYAASGSSGVDAFNLALINYSTGEVVDKTSTDGSDGVYEITNVTFPSAGTYILLIPAKEATLNFATISLDIEAGSTPEPTTEPTTAAPTTEEPTTEVTTVLAEDEIAVDVVATVDGQTVRADYVISGNSETKGFNNYTLKLTYDNTILRPVSLEPGNITLSIADATGAPMEVNASGSVIGDDDYVAFCVFDDGSCPTTSLPEFTTNGTLFTVVYEVIADGTSEISADFETINTVSSDDTIQGALKAVTTPATVTVDDGIDYPNLSIVGPTDRVEIGETITISVDMEAVTIAGGELVVKYDNTVLRPVSVATGDQLASGFFTADNLAFTEDSVFFTFASANNADINGTLVTFTFEVIGEGIAELSFNPDRTAFSDYDTVDVPVDLIGAQVYAGVDVPTTETPTEEPTVEPTTEASTDEPTTEAPTDEPTTEASTEAPTVEPTTEAPTTAPTTEPTTTAPTTSAESTETTTLRPPTGGGGGGGSSIVRVTTTTTEATTEATTSTPADRPSIITKDVEVTIGREIVKVGEVEYAVDAAPYIQAASNSTLVPLRVVSIAILGGDVETADQSSIVSWDGTTKTATILAGDDVLQFTSGSDVMVINGRTQLMDYGVKAEISNDRMYVPFRALGEALGVEVTWDADTKTAKYLANYVEETTEATTEAATEDETSDEATTVAEDETSEATTVEEATTEATTAAE